MAIGPAKLLSLVAKVLDLVAFLPNLKTGVETRIEDKGDDGLLSVDNPRIQALKGRHYQISSITSMYEIDRLQAIMIAKAACALHSIQRSTVKYKDQKRALNKIERVSKQTLHELDTLAT